ncbi:hypothetical protein LOZ39_004682 [Ophidiomyces ophidiicola]|uniref:Uncharacterized protein n=1 Tax=Ophidiomyces ophidiicola TaxID=1387563 RepID=A0ACB8V633_9EURO|nr:hypothetical protein LOZ64_001084 [Ophidiomyces ophidiicola]KAI1930559.1 hypothetical protein LOZ60_000790 [Ophidiomyces ophidiicola]KAI1965501.1 hypothetical protein LOZ59_001312 [Ophidiomyces ophidiicola]KAI1969960.1 hypothetical protein LOZ56_004049 [Ophidiomyces ophidiicola]KAI2002519.1 hypothetical protein LOZ50_004956 [Ophidiomyces ophidiicola]
MFSLPSLEPRDPHAFWYAPSQRFRRGNSQYNSHGHRPHGHNRRSDQYRTPNLPPSSDSLAALALEERAFRIRKQNIASFGYSWIRPAGYPKTMQGIREEEAEREEAANAATEGEAEFTAGTGLDGATAGDTEDPEALAAMERDLDDDIPDADETTGGLVEDGEEGLDEDDLIDDDEEALMERDLDDDVPDGFGPEEDDLDEEDDFDEHPDLDDDIPSASIHEDVDDSMMERDLDADIPDEENDIGDDDDEDDHNLQQEWEHTDTDADEDEENYSDEASYDAIDQQFSGYSHRIRSSIPGRVENSPHLPPPLIRHRETEAQRLFLDRWSGGVGDDVEDSMAAFRASGMSERSLRIPRVRTRTRRSMMSDDSNGSIE